VKVSTIKAAASIKEVDFSSNGNQLDDRALFIGFVTRQRLGKLEREGDVSPDDVERLLRGVRQYYESCQIHPSNVPSDDEVLKHARFVKLETREEAHFQDVE
jgi:hypothetical protein